MKNQYPNIKRVCCALEHINYLIFTNGSKTQTKLGYLSLLDDLPSSSRLDPKRDPPSACLLYTSDAADDLLCVDLGGRRIIKKDISW